LFVSDGHLPLDVYDQCSKNYPLEASKSDMQNKNQKPEYTTDRLMTLSNTCKENTSVNCNQKELFNPETCTNKMQAKNVKTTLQDFNAKTKRRKMKSFKMNNDITKYNKNKTESNGNFMFGNLLNDKAVSSKSFGLESANLEKEGFKKVGASTFRTEADLLVLYECICETCRNNSSGKLNSRYNSKSKQQISNVTDTKCFGDGQNTDFFCKLNSKNDRESK